MYALSGPRLLAPAPVRRAALGAKFLGYGTPRPPTPFNGAAPPTALSAFRGPEDTLRAMASAALGERGEKSVLVRGFTEWVIRDVWPKDYLGEIIAIRNVLVQPSLTRPGSPMFRYTNDPRHVEMLKDPERMVTEIRDLGSTLVDCDESAAMAATMCLLVGREVELVALGFAPQELSHVGVRAKEPKTGQWIWLDGVAGPREREAAGRAKELLTWSLD